MAHYKTTLFKGKSSGGILPRKNMPNERIDLEIDLHEAKTLPTGL